MEESVFGESLLPENPSYIDVIDWLKKPKKEDFNKRHSNIRDWALNEAWNCQRGLGKGFIGCFEYEKIISKIVDRIEYIKEASKHGQMLAKELEVAKNLSTHRINAIANSHDYSCRCGFCMEYLHRTCNGF